MSAILPNLSASAKARMDVARAEAASVAATTARMIAVEAGNIYRQARQARLNSPHPVDTPEFEALCRAEREAYKMYGEDMARARGAETEARRAAKRVPPWP